MSQLDDFLTWVQTRQRDGEVAILNGDPEPRRVLWSHDDPVTLFGAWYTASGWADVSGVFGRLGTVFSDCVSLEREMVAADVSGDLAYTVWYEHSRMSINGTATSGTLRVTQIYRREAGEWKAVHRHADSPPVPPTE